MEIGLLLRSSRRGAAAEETIDGDDTLTGMIFAERDSPI
jgi:hypothetical protein